MGANLKIQMTAALLAVLVATGIPAIAQAEQQHFLRLAADDEDERMYIVVVNNEGRQSIWPEDRALPLGWRATGFRGTKQECLDRISGGG